MAKAAPARDFPDAILVDVGNTRTKFAFATGADLHRFGSVPSAPTEMAHAARAISASELLCDAGGGLDCVVTSVKPELNGTVRRAFSHISEDFLFLDFDCVHELPVLTACEYVAPDRLADIIAVADGECPAIVIDLGTATTVDLIGPDRRHLGGAIMPGLMFIGDFSAPARPVSKAQSILGATAAATEAAAVFGHAGAIDRFCDVFAAQVGPARIVATGGFAAHIVPHCTARIVIDPDLTFRGTRRVHAWWRGDGTVSSGSGLPARCDPGAPG